MEQENATSSSSKYSLPVEEEQASGGEDPEVASLSSGVAGKKIQDDDDFEINEQDLAKPTKATGDKEFMESWHDTYNTSVTFFDREDDSNSLSDVDKDAGDEGSDDDGDETKRKQERRRSSKESNGSDGSSTVDQDEHKHSHYQQRFHSLRRKCGKLVNDPRLQMGVVVLIIINAIMMGIATFGFVLDNPDVNRKFDAVDQAFLCVFTVELAMQIFYHGLYLFRDGWLIFDFVIIIASWSLSSLQVIRTFRIFRALRLITRVQVLKKIVSALFAVMPRMTAISALLALVFYIYGVMCTYLFQDLYERGLTDDDYFSRLDVTCFTLFQIMTMEDWASVARQVMAVYSWAWAVFLSYVMITAFIVYNLVIAVVCDAVADVEHEFDEDPLENLDENHPENIRRILKLKSRMDAMTKSQTELLQTMHTAVRHLDMSSRR